MKWMHLLELFYYVNLHKIMEQYFKYLKVGLDVIHLKWKQKVALIILFEMFLVLNWNGIMIIIVFYLSIMY